MSTGTGLDEESSDRSFQYAAQSRAITPANNDAAQLLDDLLEWIGRQPIENQLRDRLQLYIAMKLEDASNREIAAALSVGILEVDSLEASLKSIAIDFLNDS